MSANDTRQPGRPQDPAALDIAPGLDTLPRQIGIFPAFRAGLLEDASAQVALASAGWRGRDAADFGVMLLEMWAYVCDVLAFYDGLYAGEAYLRTARRLSAVRRLTRLIGYLPRPAVAALVDLALSLEGRKPVTIPADTAFRSGAFEGEKPQVFTAIDPVTVHPLRAKFTLTPQPRATLPGGGSVTPQTLTFKRGSITVKADDAAVLKSGSTHAAALVASVENTEDPAGNAITKVAFKDSLKLTGGTAYSAMSLLRPTGTAFVISVGSDYFGGIGYRYNEVILDALVKPIKTGDLVLLRKGDHLRWFKAQTVSTYNRIVQSAKTITSTQGSTTTTTTIPAVTTPVTTITFDTYWDNTARRAPEDNADWAWWTYADFTLYYGMAAAGAPIGEAAPAIEADDVLKVREKVEAVDSSYEPDRFLLRDLNEDAVSADGALFTDGTLTLSDSSAWDGPFVPPVTVYGALVRATRGEVVTGEILGTGNGSTPNQSFKLKKKPLTYVTAASAESESGVQSTLTVRVDGVLWTEVPRFYGREADEAVYIIRQDDEGDSWVTFGDGARGQRLPTGAVITADYRYGAGAAAPPAGMVTQMVTPIKGVTALVNPLAAFGGADAEDEDAIKTYAPRSALMLGRAVSLLDYEAVAANTSGVTAAKAEWRWSGTQQRPVVKLWYIGDANLAAPIKDRLVAVSAEGVPFEVAPATAVSFALTIGVITDARYVADDVAGDVEAALSDAFAPAALGIGAPLIRSKVMALAAAVEGVIAPTVVTLNGAPFVSAGITAAEGTYFVFTITASAQPEG